MRTTPLDTQTALPSYLALPFAGAGVTVLAFTAVRCFGLSQGSGFARAFVFLFLTVLAAAAMVLLRSRAGLSQGLLCAALVPVAVAFFLRCVALEHITLDYQDFLSHWAAFFRDNGGFAAIKEPVGNYNVPYLYFLAAISYLPVPDLYCIKLFSILFDVILAWGGLRLAGRLVKSRESLLPTAAFLLLLLLPTVILNGAYWAQCDVIYGALVLHALASALDGRPAGSAVLLAVAFSFKLQTIFLIPLWLPLWFTRRVRFPHLCLFPLTYLATILPALLLGKPLGDILGVYVGQTAEYASRLTLNAPSWYALIPYGAQVDTQGFFLFGILAAFLLMFAVFLVLWLVRDRVTDQMVMTAAVILAVGIPFFLPSMHERYFFLADVLTLVWACSSRSQTSFTACILVQLGSLGGYHAYLKLKYACYVQLFGHGWAMGLEALAMLTALILGWLALAAQLRALPPAPAGAGRGAKK